MSEDRRGPLLAIDTATRRAVVAVGGADGTVLAQHGWTVGHRHGETLLPAVESTLARAAIGIRDVAGIVVGIGPGSFTGLRVGMTVAKTLAYGLDRPIAGVGTLAALAAASGVVGDVAVTLPAGPNDRYVAAYRVSPDAGVEEAAAPRIAPPDGSAAPPEGTRLVAVDLPDDAADPDARERGAHAIEGLGAALLRLGSARLRARADDAAQLVPAYVTLPRGLAPALAESGWSPDLR